RLAEDGVVASLMLMHGLYPVPLEDRVQEALDSVRPYMESHGGAADLLGLDVEGVVAAPRRAEPAPEAEWVELPGLAGLERGRLVAAGRGLVVANVAGTLLAYRDRCAGCGGGLAGGELAGGKLACAHCGRRFDLPRAGRSADDPALQLDPVPLLRNGGPVRVALPPEP